MFLQYKQISFPWWYAPVMSADQEFLGNMTMIQCQLWAKKHEPYLNNNLKQKGLGAELQWWITCLASIKP
jgi:hypothetical protein